MILEGGVLKKIEVDKPNGIKKEVEEIKFYTVTKEENKEIKEEAKIVKTDTKKVLVNKEHTKLQQPQQRIEQENDGPEIEDQPSEHPPELMQNGSSLPIEEPVNTKPYPNTINAQEEVEDSIRKMNAYVEYFKEYGCTTEEVMIAYTGRENPKQIVKKLVIHIIIIRLN